MHAQKKLASISSLVKASDPPQTPIIDSVMVHKIPIFPAFTRQSRHRMPRSSRHLARSSRAMHPMSVYSLKIRIKSSISNCERFSALSEIHQVGVIAKLINLLPIPECIQCNRNYIPIKTIRPPVPEQLQEGIIGYSMRHVEKNHMISTTRPSERFARKSFPPWPTWPTQSILQGTHHAS